VTTRTLHVLVQVPVLTHHIRTVRNLPVAAREALVQVPGTCTRSTVLYLGNYILLGTVLVRKEILYLSSRI
jgi:hypothetical protein